MSFVDLLDLSATRAEVIVALWTVLELFKRQVISVERPQVFDQISLGRGPRFGESWRLDAAGIDQAGGEPSPAEGPPKQ